MRLIRCPYCGVEFDRRRIKYVGADPHMQVVVGLIFIFFSVNTWLVRRFFDDYTALVLGIEFLLGLALVLHGARKYLRGRSEYMADIKRHLGGHSLHHLPTPSGAGAGAAQGDDNPASPSRTPPPSVS
jgi:hypothetical protein